MTTHEHSIEVLWECAEYPEWRDAYVQAVGAVARALPSDPGLLRIRCGTVNLDPLILKRLGRQSVEALVFECADTETAGVVSAALWAAEIATRLHVGPAEGYVPHYAAASAVLAHGYFVKLDAGGASGWRAVGIPVVAATQEQSAELVMRWASPEALGAAIADLLPKRRAKPPAKVPFTLSEHVVTVQEGYDWMQDTTGVLAGAVILDPARLIERGLTLDDVLTRVAARFKGRRTSATVWAWTGTSGSPMVDHFGLWLGITPGKAGSGGQIAKLCKDVAFAILESGDVWMAPGAEPVLAWVPDTGAVRLWPERPSRVRLSSLVAGAPEREGVDPRVASTLPSARHRVARIPSS